MRMGRQRPQLRSRRNHLDIDFAPHCIRAHDLHWPRHTCAVITYFGAAEKLRQRRNRIQRRRKPNPYRTRHPVMPHHPFQPLKR